MKKKMLLKVIKFRFTVPSCKIITQHLKAPVSEKMQKSVIKSGDSDNQGFK